MLAPNVRACTPFCASTWGLHRVTPDFVDPKSGAHHICVRIIFHIYDSTSSMIIKTVYEKEYIIIIIIRSSEFDYKQSVLL